MTAELTGEAPGRGADGFYHQPKGAGIMSKSADPKKDAKKKPTKTLKEKKAAKKAKKEGKAS